MGVEEAIRLRRAVGRLARELNATATDEGLTPSQASVLATVSVRGPIGVADLADVEHLNPTMLSRVLGALYDAGLVERRQNPGDLRAAFYEATPAGREVHERVKAQRAELVLGGIAGLSTDERTALRDALPALEALADAVRTARV
jgi:DNA-binding MarR family transcriptional regulator